MNNKIAKYISTFLLLAAASLPCATIAQGSSRTVRIAAVHSEDGMVTSVDLAVSAGADAIALYAVHGAADHGADIAAWDAVDPVCDVPAGEGEQIVNYSISRPYDAFYRFLLASVDGAPFKKQLAFLKSTGSQYFILGDKRPNQNWRVVADVKFTTLDSTVGFWAPERRRATRPSSACARAAVNFALTWQMHCPSTPGQAAGAIRSTRRIKVCPSLGMAAPTMSLSAPAPSRLPARWPSSPSTPMDRPLR